MVVQAMVWKTSCTTSTLVISHISPQYGIYIYIYIYIYILFFATTNADMFWPKTDKDLKNDIHHCFQAMCHTIPQGHYQHWRNIWGNVYGIDSTLRTVPPILPTWGPLPNKDVNAWAIFWRKLLLLVENPISETPRRRSQMTTSSILEFTSATLRSPSKRVILAISQCVTAVYFKPSSLSAHQSIWNLSCPTHLHTLHLQGGMCHRVCQAGASIPRQLRACLRRQCQSHFGEPIAFAWALSAASVVVRSRWTFASTRGLEAIWPASCEDHHGHITCWWPFADVYQTVRYL